MTFKKGDRLYWVGADYLTSVVTRVSKKGTWVDMFVYDNHTLTSYTRRVKLPLPGRWKKRV